GLRRQVWDAGRPLAGGLEGWLVALRESGKTAAELAEIHDFPEDHIAAVLAETPGDRGQSVRFACLCIQMTDEHAGIEHGSQSERSGRSVF
ncbi:MAG: hypothetical protein LBE85_10235, partial [Candidatus Accumulibacter sp.]|nr:hypothetical protein [Accumulibacter sp.]